MTPILSLQTSYYPLEWVAKGATGLLAPADIDDGAMAYLARTIGLKQVGYQDLVLARLPDDKERALFNLMHNHTVIEVSRTSFAEDQTPIGVTVTVYPSDRNRLVYKVGLVPDAAEIVALPSTASPS
jgi:GntR family transcriptional regulator